MPHTPDMDKGLRVHGDGMCGDSLLNVVESPGIHKEQVGRQWITEIDGGGRGRLGPQLVL